MRAADGGRHWKSTAGRHAPPYQATRQVLHGGRAMPRFSVEWSTGSDLQDENEQGELRSSIGIHDKPLFSAPRGPPSPRLNGGKLSESAHPQLAKHNAGSDHRCANTALLAARGLASSQSTHRPARKFVGRMGISSCEDEWWTLGGRNNPMQRLTLKHHGFFSATRVASFRSAVRLDSQNFSAPPTIA